MFSVRPLWKKRKEEALFFFFFFLSKWLPDTFSKTTGRPIFSRWLPVFCFNGPHLDSRYDISLFTAGFGKRSYFFFVFFNSLKKKKKNKEAASKKEAGGDAKHVLFFTSPYMYPKIHSVVLVDFKEFTSIFQKVQHFHSRHQKTTSHLLRINLKGI